MKKHLYLLIWQKRCKIARRNKAILILLPYYKFGHSEERSAISYSSLFIRMNTESLANVWMHNETDFLCAFLQFLPSWAWLAFPAILSCNNSIFNNLYIQREKNYLFIYFLRSWQTHITDKAYFMPKVLLLKALGFGKVKTSQR